MILFAAPQLILLQVVPRALAASYLGSIHPHRERKRILIEPKSMSARHHLALSVHHRPTPLTLSIAPPPNTIQTITPLNMASAPFALPPSGWSLGSKRGRARAVPRLRNHRCHSIDSVGVVDLSVNTLQDCARLSCI